MWIKGIYFKKKFEYISTLFERHFFVKYSNQNKHPIMFFLVRNLNKYKLTRCNYVKCLKEQEEIIIIQFVLINALVT